VTDYGVRLTVREGILSPLAYAPFRVVLLYTVSPLRGGRSTVLSKGSLPRATLAPHVVLKFEFLPSEENWSANS
jgi:hypothetical protein